MSPADQSLPGLRQLMMVKSGDGVQSLEPGMVTNQGAVSFFALYLTCLLVSSHSR
ncbi:hypothetical protein SAMN02745166_01611 [Prosthecobacter debontii]|uniref:Uncharacterized protein n=1 Tax=Prosthecobacter debontii TaxID=48467 RepID=A0A1T4XJM8_9BACT|nr:hypothetical protein SAMN02745166_01611 [Prosthecobacter debontii]